MAAQQFFSTGKAKEAICNTAGGFLFLSALLGKSMRRTPKLTQSYLMISDVTEYTNSPVMASTSSTSAAIEASSAS